MATSARLQEFYIAYYGRPADVTGLDYWSGISGSESNLVTNFGSVLQAEFVNLYGASPAPATFVQSVYNNLFGRDADTAGLKYWIGVFNDKVSAGQTADSVRAEMVMWILGGAQSADRAIINAKVTAAQAWTAALDTSAEIAAYDNVANLGGQAVARAWLSEVVSSATAASQTTSSVLGDALNEVIGSNNAGDSFTLTNEADTLKFTTSGVIDTVKGTYFSDATENTFSVGDSIAGNGHTKVEVVVADATTALLPHVTMSGVDELSFAMGVADNITVDASTYGSDISSIKVSGLDGSNVDVEDLVVKGNLDVSISAGTDASLTVSGTMDGYYYSVNLDNSDTDSVASVASIGKAGVQAVLGEDDSLDFSITQSNSDSAASVSVGDLTIADISYVIGASAYVNASFTNYAYNSGTGSATAGSLTIGNINAEFAVDAYSADFYIYNSATADSGAATVGNVTLGSIDYQIADDATGMSSFTIYNNADSTKGNATAGNITLGSVNVVAGDDVDYGGYLYVYNTATANTSGNAKVGNLTLASLDLVAGDDMGYAGYGLYQNADATKGTATVGDITVGNVNINVGYDADVSLTASNDASATTGNATAGNITIGDINASIGSEASLSLYFSNEADTAKGAAKVGTITIGDINIDGGVNSTIAITISASADGTAGDVVGDIAIGNVDIYGQQSASIDFEVTAYADEGVVGNFTIGDVNLSVDGSGSIGFSVDIDGEKGVGDITVGDVTLTLGSDASIDTFYLSVSASDGSIGNFAVGNILINAGIDSSDDDMYIHAYAEDDIGDITFGNLTVNAAKSASMTDAFYAYFTANNGAIGDISIGDINYVAAQNASVTGYMYAFAEDGIGDVTVGDVNLTAAKGATAYFSATVSASDDIGAIKVGDLNLSAIGGGAPYGYAGFYLYGNANGNDILSVDIGDVDLYAKAGTSEAYASGGAYFTDTSDDVGLVTVGNITMKAENVDDATDYAYVGFYVESLGDIKVGNINMTAGDVTADYVNSATVSGYLFFETGGNLTVGNITVTGGQSNGNDVVLDNQAVLTSWLDLSETGSGSITVGNIDYRGYESSATIDVSAWKGAATIWAAQDDTTITDNKTKNVIYLGAGDDTVNMVATGLTIDKSSSTAIDEIINFVTTKDELSISTTSNENAFVFVSSSTNYADFLTAAATNMTNYGTDIYARKVGSDVFVAIDDNANGSVDMVIKLTGINSIDSGDITIV